MPLAHLWLAAYMQKINLVTQNLASLFIKLDTMEGLRTLTYFHNMIGLLTEIIGSPTPINISVVPDRLITSSANPYAILPQKWHFRQSIDYSVSLNYGMLKYEVRHRDELLYNIYKMSKTSIQKGEKETWMLLPKRSAEIIKLAQMAQPIALTRTENNTRGKGHLAIHWQLWKRSYWIKISINKLSKGFIALNIMILITLPTQ